MPFDRPNRKFHPYNLSVYTLLFLKKPVMLSAIAKTCFLQTYLKAVLK